MRNGRRVVDIIEVLTAYMHATCVQHACNDASASEAAAFLLSIKSDSALTETLCRCPRVMSVSVGRAWLHVDSLSDPPRTRSWVGLRLTAKDGGKGPGPNAYGIRVSLKAYYQAISYILVY